MEAESAAAAVAVREDIQIACEMALRDSGGCKAMGEILMSLHSHEPVNLNRAFSHLDRNNQRIALRIINCAVLNIYFPWDQFNTAMKPVARLIRSENAR